MLLYNVLLGVCLSGLLVGSRRASNEPDEFEFVEQTGKVGAMTEEQRKYLRWYYRTEDRECS